MHFPQVVPFGTVHRLSDEDDEDDNDHGIRPPPVGQENPTGWSVIVDVRISK